MAQDYAGAFWTMFHGLPYSARSGVLKVAAEGLRQMAESARDADDADVPLQVRGNVIDACRALALCLEAELHVAAHVTPSKINEYNA